MFLDASRNENVAQRDRIWMDFGTHFGSFSGRGRYAKSAYSTMVLLLFHALRGSKNEVKSDLQYSTPKKMPNMLNMAPQGFRFGVIFGTFGDLFCMLFFDSKIGTLEESLRSATTRVNSLTGEPQRSYLTKVK